MFYVHDIFFQIIYFIWWSLEIHFWHYWESLMKALSQGMLLLTLQKFKIFISSDIIVKWLHGRSFPLHYHFYVLKNFIISFWCKTEGKNELAEILSEHFCSLSVMSRFIAHLFLMLVFFRSFLKDLVETTHLFLKMLEKMCKGSSHFVVQKKKTKKRKKNKLKCKISNIFSWFISCASAHVHILNIKK